MKNLSKNLKFRNFSEYLIRKKLKHTGDINYKNISIDFLFTDSEFFEKKLNLLKSPPIFFSIYLS